MVIDNVTQCIEEAVPTILKIIRKLINKIEIANDCGKIINFAVWECALIFMRVKAQNGFQRFYYA